MVRIRERSRVSRGRLNPDFLKRALPQQPPVGDTVQRDTARKREVLHAGDLVRVARHSQDDLLRYRLDRRGNVHFALRDLRFGGSRGPVEELLHLRGRHAVVVTEREVIHVHPERAVLFEIE